MALLLDKELLYPGFLALFSQCIRMDNQIMKKVQENKVELLRGWEMQPTEMPEQIPMSATHVGFGAADFLEFRPRTFKPQ
jgi:hypothetical protein